MTDMHLLALSSVPEIGPVKGHKLISAFGSPEAVFGAGLRDLMSVDGISRTSAAFIKEFSEWDRLGRETEVLGKKGVRVVTYGSEEYPQALAHFPDAPLVLYVKGDLLPDDRFSIAVVGTRRPSAYGRNVTEGMASELASKGLTVVSGLARGIDTAAHKGALSAGGRSIAVLGSGIDVPYPPENRDLMERLASSGCVISEFPPGTSPNRENFPRRNRIISGLSLGVLVVEAQADSGSLITAKCALDQGREVFAIPGNINSANSRGTNELIKSGARAVTGASDIIEELAPVLKGFIKSSKKANINVSDEERAVCSAMSGEPRHVDEISRECRLPSSRTLGILLGLELKGLACQMEGKRYYLRHHG